MPNLAKNKATIGACDAGGKFARIYAVEKDDAKIPGAR
jgi:hypothetical protein